MIYQYYPRTALQSAVAGGQDDWPAEDEQGLRPEGGHCRNTCSDHGWQQQRNQIRRALKEALEPVICFQGPPPDIANRATNPVSRRYVSTYSESSAFPQLLHQAPAVGECDRRDRTPGGRQPPLSTACPPSTSTAPPARGAGPTAPPAAPDTAPPHAIPTNYSPSGALGPQPLRSSSQAAR